MKKVILLYSVFIFLLSLIISLGLFTMNIIAIFKDYQIVPFIVINIIGIYFVWNVIHFLKCLIYIKKINLPEKKKFLKTQNHNYIILGINALFGSISLLMLLYLLIILHTFSWVTILFLSVFVYNFLYVIGTVLINIGFEQIIKEGLF